MPGNPLTDQNWATDVTDQITTFVGDVRDKTTNNAVKAARMVVFALTGLFLGIVAVAVLLILLTRGLQAILDLFLNRGRSVYLSYFVVGGIFVLAGMLAMGKRHSTS